MLVVPVGILVDMLLGKGTLSFISFLGVILVVVGFVVLNSGKVAKKLFRKFNKMTKENEADPLIP